MLNTGDPEFDMVCSSINHNSLNKIQRFLCFSICFPSAVSSRCMSELVHVVEVYIQHSKLIYLWGLGNRCVNITDLGLKALAVKCSRLQSLRSDMTLC